MYNFVVSTSSIRDSWSFNETRVKDEIQVVVHCSVGTSIIKASCNSGILSKLMNCHVTEVHCTEICALTWRVMVKVRFLVHKRNRSKVKFPKCLMSNAHCITENHGLQEGAIGDRDPPFEAIYSSSEPYYLLTYSLHGAESFLRS